ncbi:unnamed protein product (macronuclear) [Paramecium tetraurelia]|uniref:Uncharacterized protein n=1 Tax=Paramecium tetraurelia TaxID=5888 RepID=A0BPZ2_PARTE|nr:uncharacterized protein GSPATT00005360001 [Paramecium tetraurelia]CAK60609.1 unnamed protein product [Paramecium tetraurelia]|eukprot:XP_001428007.1 hypothetical protein (macronuclear) [Paramecium tetraurelia strain d4-2]
MQSIRAQRMKKIMQVQGEVGQHKGYTAIKIAGNAHELIRKSKSAANNIGELAIQDVTKKLLQDQFNSIKSYDIAKGEEKPGQSFKSMHNMYDLQTLKITKLYKKKERNQLEQQIRSQLARDPDKQLLLSEIYEQLEDNSDGEVLKKKQKNKEESLATHQEDYDESQDQTADLKVWTKRLKEQKKKEESKQEDSSKFNVIPQRNKQRASTEIKKQIPFQQSVRQLPLERQNSSQNSVPSQSTPRSFKDVMKNAVQKVKQLKNLNEDLSVERSVEQYIQKASAVALSELKEIGELNVDEEKGLTTNFDFTSEGVQRMYNTLVKVQMSQFKSEAEKAKFYKKQTQLISNKLIFKIKQNNIIIEARVVAQEKLRLETHEYHEKIGQIKQLTEQLLQEIIDLKDPRSQGSLSMSKSRMSLVNSFMNQQNKQKELDQDLQILRDSKKAYKQKILFNKKTLEQIDQDIHIKKKENKSLQKCLVSFYFQVLKNGQDVRTTGIAWVISKLNSLNEKCHYSFLPDYLDQKAKEYLLQKATMLSDIEQLEKELSESFKQYKQEQSLDSSLAILQQSLSQNDSLEASSLPSIFPFDSHKLSSIDLHQARQDVAKTCRNNYSLEKLGPITLGLTNEDIENLENMLAKLNQKNQPVTNGTLIYKETQKRIKQQIKQKGQMEVSQINDQSAVLKEQAIHSYDKCNTQLNKIKLKLSHSEDEQVIRIVKEFDYKNYGKRFSIDPITVISCLVGGARCDREIVKYGMKKIHYE